MNEEFKLVMHSSKKAKYIGLDGWTQEFCLGFYDMLEEDLLRVVEES